MIYWHLIVNVVCGKKARQVWYIGNKCIYAEANPLTHTQSIMTCLPLRTFQTHCYNPLYSQGVCSPSSLNFWRLLPTFWNSLPWIFWNVDKQKVLTLLSNIQQLPNNKRVEIFCWKNKPFKMLTDFWLPFCIDYLWLFPSCCAHNKASYGLYFVRNPSEFAGLFLSSL